MSYRFLIINTDYNEFLKWLYARNSALKTRPYDEQMRARNESLFGIADFYSNNLRNLGHEAYEICANNEFMQRRWAEEHGMRVIKLLPGYRFWVYRILKEQIRYYRPDALLNCDIGLSNNFFQEVKPYVRLLIGQYAAPLPRQKDFGAYDLMISSLPNLVDYFRQRGMKSEFFRLGFEPAVLDQLGEKKDGVPVSFVGSLFDAHVSRRQWLNTVCQHADVKVWGHGINGLSKRSILSDSYQGPAWGIEMYKILRTSKITLNHHIDVAGYYANNMRIFEATGVGTLLITDWKENLRDMFEPGKEVVTYKTPEECVELIRYYLEHDDEREAIAHAGQQRTLQDHTYLQRMEELIAIIQNSLT